jgi:hypothetical protein
LLDTGCLLLLSLLVDQDLLLSPLMLTLLDKSFLDFLDPLGLFSRPVLNDLLLLVKFQELNFQLAHRLDLILIIDLNVSLLHNEIDLWSNLVDCLFVGADVNNVLDQGRRRTSNCLAVVSHWSFLFLILRLVAHKELVLLLHQRFGLKLCLDVVLLILEFFAHLSDPSIAFLFQDFELFFVVLAQIDVEKIGLLNSEKMLD